MLRGLYGENEACYDGDDVMLEPGWRSYDHLIVLYYCRKCEGGSFVNRIGENQNWTVL